MRRNKKSAGVVQYKEEDDNDEVEEEEDSDEELPEKWYRYMVSLSEQCGKEHTEHSRSAKPVGPASQTGSEKTFLFEQSC